MKKKAVVVNTMDLLATEKVLKQMLKVCGDDFTKSTIKIVLKLVKKCWKKVRYEK